ncbi:MAG: hypothetical protein MJY69_04265 [Bacteroidales bacterium]|nr:hypothetical protein [Bacteroidales bacterium]
MKKILFLILFAIIEFQVWGQNNFQKEFDDFFKEASNEFDSFRDQINKQYADFLLTNWKEFTAMAPIEKPEQKPLPPVRYENNLEIKDKDIKPVPIHFDKVIQAPAPKPQPKPVEPIKKSKETTLENINFSCFGMNLTVRVPQSRRKFKLESLNLGDLSRGWKKLSSHSYDSMISDCLEIRTQKKLCDWAYLQLLKSFVNSYLGNSDSATFMIAYIFSQSGYKMRLGLDGDRLFFLYGTDCIVYNRPFFKINGSNYYVFDSDENKLFIADIPYPEEEGLSLKIEQEQMFGDAGHKKRNFKSERYSVTSECDINEEQIRFFDTYPSGQIGDDFMTRWAIYANTPLSESAKNILYPSLIKKIDGKTEIEGADILLDFVQTSFEYEYDDKVWGGDRVFFAEETLYYPYCDCEDRSILYSHLVRDLLGLDVALIYYPNHLATAVKFSNGPEGDYIQLEEGDFTICDPTFIGAPVGNTMTGMDNSSVNIIVL